METYTPQHPVLARAHQYIIEQIQTRDEFFGKNTDGVYITPKEIDITGQASLGKGLDLITSNAKSPDVAKVLLHAGFGTNPARLMVDINTQFREGDKETRALILDVAVLSAYTHYVFSELDSFIDGEKETGVKSSLFSTRLQNRESTTLENFDKKRMLVSQLSKDYTVGAGQYEAPVNQEAGLAYDLLIKKTKELADKINIPATPSDRIPPMNDNNIGGRG